MTDTIEPMARVIDYQLAKDLVETAWADGMGLIGPGGLLTGLTKRCSRPLWRRSSVSIWVMTSTNPAGHNRGNSRNGTRAKTVLTEAGPVQSEVPRDREGSFEPGIVRKRRRRLDGIDQIVLSLTARGLTTGEVAVHFAEVYCAKVNRMAQRLLRMRSPGCSTHSVLARRPRDSPTSSASSWAWISRRAMSSMCSLLRSWPTAARLCVRTGRRRASKSASRVPRASWSSRRPGPGLRRASGTPPRAWRLGAGRRRAVRHPAAAPRGRRGGRPSRTCGRSGRQVRWDADVTASTLLVAAQLASSFCVLGRAAGFGGVDEHRQAGVGGKLEGVVHQFQAPDDGVVDLLGAGSVQADIVRGPSGPGTPRCALRAP